MGKPAFLAASMMVVPSGTETAAPLMVMLTMPFSSLL